MYGISEACRKALNGLRVTTKLEGILRLNDGTGILLENKDFSQGGLSINNKCVSGNDFEYGAVYCAELLAGVQTEADRYLFYDGTIAVKVCIMLADETWESIPMGQYNITEAERTGRSVEIKAYDNMVLMGNPIDLEVTDLTGSPFEILSALAEMSGVSLSQNREEIESFPNGSIPLSITVSDGDMSPRDVLGELCTLLCSFAIFDRDGNLSIGKYGSQSVFMATGRKKTGTKISDYVVRYKGLKAQINGKNLYDTDDSMQGLILDIGANKFLQRGLDIQKEEILRNMRDTLTAIQYTPCSTELMTGFPALDLGDLIEVEDQYGANIFTYVMSYNWKYRGKHSIKGVGSNPRMHVRSQTEKAIADVADSVNAKDVIVHTYTNIAAYTLKSQEKEIISINYATITNARIIFIATIPFTMDLDGYMIFSYYVDGVLMPEDTVRQYAARGEHFATISNNMTMEKDTRRTLVVKACTQYYESDTRQQDARIRAIENYITTQKYTEQPVDATLPVANIAAGAIKAVLYAQGLAGTEVWDGTINIADYITPMGLPMLPMAGITATATLKDITGPGRGVLEGIAPMNLPMLSLVGIVAEAAANQIVTNYTFDTAKSQECQYNSIYVSADGSYRLNTEYDYTGSSQDIDRGSMCAVVISTTEFTTVRSITLTAGSASTPGAKYLIACEGIFYNIVDGTSTELPVTDLTADDFAAYGNDEAPDGSWLFGMDNPQVLCWAASQDALPALAAHVVAIPGAQAVISGAIDLSHDSIKGIESMTAKCDGPLILAASVDDKHTWMAWNGTEWISLSEAYSGMSKEALEAVTADQWQQLISGAQEMNIRISLVSEEQAISVLYISFINQEENHGY